MGRAVDSVVQSFLDFYRSLSCIVIISVATYIDVHGLIFKEGDDNFNVAAFFGLITVFSIHFISLIHFLFYNIMHLSICRGCTTFPLLKEEEGILISCLEVLLLISLSFSIVKPLPFLLSL